MSEDENVTPVTYWELGAAEQSLAREGITQIIQHSLTGGGPAGLPTTARSSGATVMLPDGPGKWKAVSFAGDHVVEFIRKVIEEESGTKKKPGSGEEEEGALYNLGAFQWTTYVVSNPLYTELHLRLRLPDGVSLQGNLYAWAHGECRYRLSGDTEDTVWPVSRYWAHPSGPPPRQTGVVTYAPPNPPAVPNFTAYLWYGSYYEFTKVFSRGYDWIPADFETTSRGGPEVDFNSIYRNDDVSVAVGLYGGAGSGGPWESAPSEDPGLNPAAPRLYWSGSGWSTEEPVPAPAMCHAVLAERAPEPGPQCPQTGVNAEVAVEVDVRDAGGQAVGGWLGVRLEKEAMWRTQGGPQGAVGTGDQGVMLLGEPTSLSLPPQAALCPLDGSPQSSLLYSFTLPSGSTFRAAVPDTLAARLEDLLTAETAPQPSNETCAVSLRGEPFGTVYVRLGGLAKWTRPDGSTALVDTRETAVSLDQLGQGVVELIPTDALRGKGAALPPWEFKFPNSPGWARVSVPDEPTKDFAELEAGAD